VLEVVLRATRLGNLAAVGTAFFGVIISLYGMTALREHPERGRFAAFLLWTLCGALVAVWADNLLFMLVGWETVTLMLYLMVNANPSGARPAEKAYGILGFTDVGLLMAIAFLMAVGKTRGLSLSDSTIHVGSTGTAMAYLLFLAAALAKAGAWPLHTWLPPVAKGTPAIVSALLPASLDKLLGIYLLARVSLDLFVLAPWVNTLLMVIGAVTILSAVLMAMVQHDLKRLLGFHAVSQVGYMVLGIGTGIPLGVAGGLFHMVNHALYKSGLFLVAGTVERYAKTVELDDLGGLRRALPWTLGVAITTAMAISGVPPTNGFASKWLVYQGTLAVGGTLGMLVFAVAVFGSALTLASFVKVLHSVFWGPETERSAPAGRPEPLGMILPMLLIATLCVVLGIWAGPSLGVWIAPALDELGFSLPPDQLQGLSFGNGAWNPLLATILLACGGALGLLIYAVGGVRRARVADAFVAGERFGDRPPFFSGTHFFVTIQRLPLLGGLLRDGEAGAFDPYRWAGLLGGIVVAALRSLHSGLLNMYVSWALIGLAVLVLALVL
jgi:formate hydrogenlyase subunit 3/multisubunit Na+/H+ antiporter MnhD subunit